MFNFDETQLLQLAVHKIGSKTDEEGIVASKGLVPMSQELNELLHMYFLSPFSSEAFYHFTVEHNKVQSIVNDLFAGESDFYSASVELAEMLYQKSDHPKIKSGDLFVAKFTNCVVDDELCDAIGIFKAENKDTYLRIELKGSELKLDYDSGININKLDKACLIFSTEAQLGYKISIIDTQNKGAEAQFWKEAFLGVKMRDNDFYRTSNYMALCKGFVNEVYNESNNIEKADQLDMLKQSVNYFKKNEKFDESDFLQTIMPEQEVKEAFKEYKNHFQEANEIDIPDSFEISNEAVKKKQGDFKSVLKLDKNFHIYLHGTRDRLEKGFDSDKKMNYYKIFYDKEQ